MIAEFANFASLPRFSFCNALRTARKTTRSTLYRRMAGHLPLFGDMFRDTAGHEDLTEKIIECGIRVHDELGPGLYESIYKTCLVIELEEAGLAVELDRRVPVCYRGRVLQAEFCPDVIVAGIVIVELKAVERLAPIHTSQVVTYLKITGLPVGLLMNFNVPVLRQGIRRVVRPDLYVKK